MARILDNSRNSSKLRDRRCTILIKELNPDLINSYDDYSHVAEGKPQPLLKSLRGVRGFRSCPAVFAVEDRPRVQPLVGALNGVGLHEKQVCSMEIETPQVYVVATRYRVLLLQ